MSLLSRTRAAAHAAASDVGAWPLGMLGFLVRGGLIVLALPILTLPSPVGIGTLLGPALISTGRLDGPRLTLVVGVGVLLLVVTVIAMVLAAWVEQAVHLRRKPLDRLRLGRALGRLLAVEALALAPVVIVLAVAGTALVGEVYDELLLPGDLSVPLLARVVARTTVPLAALVAAIALAEAIDGAMARRVLVGLRRQRTMGRAVVSVVATAAFGWLLTLAVLVPGLLVLGELWGVGRVAWRWAIDAGGGALDPGSPVAITMTVLAIVLMVAAWLGLLLLCGLASLARAHLWTSRVAGSGPDGSVAPDGPASD